MIFLKTLMLSYCSIIFQKVCSPFEKPLLLQICRLLRFLIVICSLSLYIHVYIVFLYESYWYVCHVHRGFTHPTTYFSSASALAAQQQERKIREDSKDGKDSDEYDDGMYSGLIFFSDFF